jgi:hypothetical protein
MMMPTDQRGAVEASERIGDRTDRVQDVQSVEQVGSECFDVV